MSARRASPNKSNENAKSAALPAAALPTARPRTLLVLAVSSLTLLALVLIFQIPSDPQKHAQRIARSLQAWFPSLNPKSSQQTPDPARYQSLLEELSHQQQELSQQYLALSNPQEQDGILEQAQDLLNQTLPELMRCWLGTPWDFNGTATIPGEGHIACGYYVSTILRDAGFRVDRIPLAQQASQTIIATFLPREAMLIKVGTDYSRYIDIVRSLPTGIHIVGLDNHVAFVVTTEEDFRFIHASGIFPKEVVDQDSEAARSLKHSRYRVIGNLTANKEVLRKWLLGKPFPTHGLSQSS